MVAYGGCTVKKKNLSITEMLASGDLKSGASISCSTHPQPPNPKIDTPPPPLNYDNHGNGLGHYVKSYMKYIPSKFAFVGVKNAPETVLFGKKLAKF